MRLLFVDDEGFVLEALQRLLTRWRPEWDLAFASGGEAALAELRENPADVIIADMRMPHMDGVELLARVRELHPGVVRIILSGYADPDSSLRAAKVAHQFLLKPFDPVEFETTLQRINDLGELFGNDAIRRVVGAVESLPRPPRVHTELMELLARSETSVEQVVEILKRDPPITDKVLELARSGFAGRVTDTMSVDDAAARLGCNVVMSLALTAVVFSAFRFDEVIADFSIGEEQAHALRVAHAARIVAAQLDADDAFTAGMLHDVGKLLLASTKPTDFRRYLERARAEHSHVHDVEYPELQTSHAEVGAYLLGVWGLPHTIVEAIAHHHCPKRVTHPTLDVLAAVHIGDALVRESERAGTDGTATLVDADLLERIGAADRIAEWRDAVAGLDDPT